MLDERLGKFVTDVERLSAPVSYTHLDVYKRQDFNDASKIPSARFQYLISEMRKYVADQLLLENPDPEIFDENGTPIF